VTAPGWLTSSLAEVPAADAWLADGERRALAALRVEKRRADWRLGRWAAKAAVGAWLAVPAARIEIVAAADGAPEAWLDGVRVPVSVSLSHRGGRALAAVTAAPGVIGCDLELVEPRSGAFVREWLAPEEQRLVATSAADARDGVANLVWTAKEAAAKLRREGLRLDIRRAVVDVPDVAGRSGEWRSLTVDWGGARSAGWWRSEPGWVMTIMGDPPPDAPRRIGEVGLARQGRAG
jgi:4'-phosphopantetheinyl transferase